MLSVGRRGSGDWRDGCEGGRARVVDSGKAIEGEREMMKEECCDDDVGVAVVFVVVCRFGGNDEGEGRERRGMLEEALGIERESEADE